MYHSSKYSRHSNIPEILNVQHFSNTTEIWLWNTRDNLKNKFVWQKKSISCLWLIGSHVKWLGLDQNQLPHLTLMYWKGPKFWSLYESRITYIHYKCGPALRFGMPLSQLNRLCVRLEILTSKRSIGSPVGNVTLFASKKVSWIPLLQRCKKELQKWSRK